MPPVPFQRPRAFIVDDSATICSILRTHLTNAGWIVYTFQDPLEALLYVYGHATAPATVVLMDLSMPKMDGYTLIQHLRKNAPESWRSVPCIAISGSTSPSDRAKARLAGFCAYLARPFQVQALFALLREQFSHLFAVPPAASEETCPG